jgi:hypothetical protein
MIIAIGIVLALLPVIIGSVRSVGWTAAILIALCSVPMVWLSLAGMLGGAAVPWVIALLISCCATNGRDVAAKQRHAELMAALQPKPAVADTPVDRFMRSGPK